MTLVYCSSPLVDLMGKTEHNVKFAVLMRARFCLPHLASVVYAALMSMIKYCSSPLVDLMGKTEHNVKSAVLMRVRFCLPRPASVEYAVLMSTVKHCLCFLGDHGIHTFVLTVLKVMSIWRC